MTRTTALPSLSRPHTCAQAPSIRPQSQGKRAPEAPVLPMSLPTAMSRLHKSLSCLCCSLTERVHTQPPPLCRTGALEHSSESYELSSLA